MNNSKLKYYYCALFLRCKSWAIAQKQELKQLGGSNFIKEIAK